MFKTWTKTLTRPGEKVFAATRDKPSATLAAALAWILLATIVAALIGLMKAKLTGMWVIPPPEMEWPAPSKFRLEIAEIWGLYVVERSLILSKIWKFFGKLWAHSGLIYIDIFGIDIFRFDRFLQSNLNIIDWGRILLSPVFFLVSVGIYHYIATLLGGRGQFGRYAYLVAAFGAPITILKSLLSFLSLGGVGLAAVLPGTPHMTGQHWYYELHFFIATLGSLFILPAYWIFLMYVATKVEHGLPGWRVIIGVVTSSLLVLAIRIGIVHGYLGLYQARHFLPE